MPSKTDPAAEFAAMCEKLAPATNAIGSNHLMRRFNVEPLSHEFHQIVFCIFERANQIKTLVNELPDASHIASDLSQHIDDLLLGFQPNSMVARWDQAGANHVHAKNIQPIKMISALLRTHVSYPDLTKEEQNEVLVLVAELISWLDEVQMAENDFIRQAIIDGLRQFTFRLEHIEWLGWGYAVGSLRDVIGAYLALERGVPIDGTAPQAEAILKKVGSTLKRVFLCAGVAKDVVERGDFLLKAYGAASLFLHSSKGIALLLGPS